MEVIPDRTPSYRNQQDGYQHRADYTKPSGGMVSTRSKYDQPERDHHQHAADKPSQACHGTHYPGNPAKNAEQGICRHLFFAGSHSARFAFIRNGSQWYGSLTPQTERNASYFAASQGCRVVIRPARASIILAAPRKAFTSVRGRKIGPAPSDNLVQLTAIRKEKEKAFYVARILSRMLNRLQLPGQSRD